MRARHLLPAALGVGALLVGVSVRAEEPLSVEERLSRLEGRVDALEKRLEPLFQAIEGRHPDLVQLRRSSNETAALATLRNFLSAQAQLQASAKADVDQDGEGEYGGFLELSGSSAGRMAAPLQPPVLSQAFAVLDGYGAVSRSGYHFRMFLVGPEGVGVGEPQAGFDATSALEADLCEKFFCCYAWPVERGASGVRTFVVNQAGEIFTTESTTYSGADRGPAPAAAFVTKGRIDGELANGVKGNDGNVWKVVR